MIANSFQQLERSSGFPAPSKQGLSVPVIFFTSHPPPNCIKFAITQSVRSYIYVLLKFGMLAECKCVRMCVCMGECFLFMIIFFFLFLHIQSYSIWYSQEVTHLYTGQALCCLTTVIVPELIFQHDIATSLREISVIYCDKKLGIYL